MVPSTTSAPRFRIACLFWKLAQAIAICLTAGVLVGVYVSLEATSQPLQHFVFNCVRHLFPDTSPQKVEQAVTISSIFHSPEAFKLSYQEMERRFKIFVYQDGNPNTYYHTPGRLSGKYASEGYFFRNIRESRFLTKDPEKAHFFFIPISCQRMRAKGLRYEQMTRIVQEYVESLILKYPYWNRTSGADHFFVTCHEIGLNATVGVPQLVKNSIRVVCSPGDDGYIPHKDITFPQIVLPFSHPAAKFDPENRTTLGFWAGISRRSELRKKLASAWQNDTELDIQRNRSIRKTGTAIYMNKLNTAKFCICPSSMSQAQGSRIALSIHHGCVPVILADRYELPFNEILDWTKFSIRIKEDGILQLKRILKRISNARFRFLHYNVVKVQSHLHWNSPPVKYDAFHMVMYQLWLRRHVNKK